MISEGEGNRNQLVHPHGKDERMAQVLKIFDRIAKDDFKPFEYAKSYVFPFQVDEEFLSKFSVAANSLSENLDFGDIDFEATTRFQDLTVLKHNNFETFVKNAGDKKEPESIKLKWRSFGIKPNGEVNGSRIELKCVTEKKLEIDVQSPEKVKVASIRISVSGSDENWVKSSFHELEQYVPNAQISGLLRPLAVFRNQWWVMSLSIAGAIFIQTVAGDIYSNFYFEDRYLERAETLDELIQTDGVSNKLDAFFRYLLDREQPLWYQGYSRVTIRLASLCIGLFTLIKVLPTLAPTSSIGIGLSNRRAKSRENIYRVMVVSILMLGILIPTFRDAITSVFAR
ncbi:hypothetical protein [uncultured Roseobacter sp.]|uniref:hypothetical protein n=1 Tax=uncultured Roseobacter sp. TaxID=114847 RepID=UPI00260A232A|nr:hypothetical protein [uncultured Roseobacter sp.]